MLEMGWAKLTGSATVIAMIGTSDRSWWLAKAQSSSSSSACSLTSGWLLGLVAEAPLAARPAQP